MRWPPIPPMAPPARQPFSFLPSALAPSGMASRMAMAPMASFDFMMDPFAVSDSIAPPHVGGERHARPRHSSLGSRLDSYAIVRARAAVAARGREHARSMKTLEWFARLDAAHASDEVIATLGAFLARRSPHDAAQRP